MNKVCNNSTMNDFDIQATFRRIREAKKPFPGNLDKLLKSLKAWHKKTGGLSLKQIELLRNIEQQIN